MITKLEIGSLSFNDNPSYIITETAGLAMPPMRVVNYNLAGEHFGLFVSALYGKRAFSLRGWVVGSSVNDFISKRDAFQSILDILTNEQTIKITLANGRLVQIDAVCTALDFSPKAGEVNATQFSASFQASFPFLVGQTLNSQNITLASGGGGKVPPDTMPMALNADSGGKITVVNNGNGIYYPSARIYGPVTNPALRNDTLQKEINFTLTLVSSEHLDVDFKRKTVTDSYGTNRYSTKSGDWWYLQPGSNVIKYLAGVYDPTTYTTLSFRDSYLGI